MIAAALKSFNNAHERSILMGLICDCYIKNFFCVGYPQPCKIAAAESKTTLMWRCIICVIDGMECTGVTRSLDHVLPVVVRSMMSHSLRCTETGQNHIGMSALFQLIPTPFPSDPQFSRT